MSLFEVFALGVGLSMDAFAISVTNGLVCKNVNLKSAVKIGVFFGVAQGIMPLIGFFLGKMFENFIKSVDHWIAFLLLLFIGGKMIIDVVCGEDEEACLVLNFKGLFIQAVATSIDALAVGIGFIAYDNMNIGLSVSVIGLTTFTLCVIGTLIGKFAGKKLGKYAEVAGGIILIAIGAKILIEHLFF